MVKVYEVSVCPRDGKRYVPNAGTIWFISLGDTPTFRVCEFRGDCIMPKKNDQSASCNDHSSIIDGRPVIGTEKENFIPKEDKMTSDSIDATPKKDSKKFKQGYRGLVGIKIINSGDVEKTAGFCLDNDYPFEFIQNNIFIFKFKLAKKVKAYLNEAKIEIKLVPVVSIRELPPEKRNELRKKNLKGGIPIVPTI